MRRHTIDMEVQRKRLIYIYLSSQIYRQKGIDRYTDRKVETNIQTESYRQIYRHNGKDKYSDRKV